MGKCLSNPCLPHVSVPLVLANHMAKPRVNMGRDHTGIRVLGNMTYWGPPMSQFTPYCCIAEQQAHLENPMKMFLMVSFAAEGLHTEQQKKCEG